MVKLLVSLSLVMTQLYSWSAAPLFLCVSGNGSVCVDAGPEACDCCDEADSDHCTTVGCEHQHDHDAELAAEEHRCADTGTHSLSSGCGCRHLQLSQGSVIASRGTTSHDVDLQPIRAGLPFAVAILPTLTGHAGLEAGPTFPAFFAAHVVGSVMLRC
jgi:hypothetical protein